MVKETFEKKCGAACGYLCQREKELRAQILTCLGDAIEIAQVREPDADYVSYLHQLQNALHAKGAAAIIYRYEETKPASLTSARIRKNFSEALLSVNDENGNHIPTENVLSALNHVNLAVDLGAKFRLWLMVAQINDFYKANTPSKRLSINVLPTDVDLPCYRDTLPNVAKMAEECGYKIILEAVEKGEWTHARRDFLTGLGMGIAIDDYGAPDGQNHAPMLERFKDIPNLIIKIDGKLIRDFLEKDDSALVDRLREIKAYCPCNQIVAEWVNGIDEIEILQERLTAEGLPDAIDMVQSMKIEGSMREFIRSMRLREKKPAAGGPPPPAPAA